MFLYKGHRGLATIYISWMVVYIRDTEAWQPSIYLGWLLRQNPPVKYAMLEKTQLFRIFDNVSSKCLGLVVKETVCP